jgi:DNA-binding transcriptional MerR regulator
MSRDGLLIGEVAKRTGATRKALRLYEEASILAAPRRTIACYRVYGPDRLELLAFVHQAQRLGFSLDEIKEIVSIQRSGRLPCPTFTIWCHGNGPTSTEGSQTSGKCGSGWTWCSEAGGRGAEQRPSAFISNSRTDNQGGERMEKRVWNVLVDLVLSGRLSKL